MGKPRKRPKPRGQSGQVSIMLAMMMMTFLLFFCFVINTGMLVHAKINLQNAVDLAAYAGAAAQGRQLNHISYLNYEMRRQYKKLLFRYYVMGNMAQASFPRNGPNPVGRLFSPDGTIDFGVPSTCVIFNANDNYCQNAKLPTISIPKATPMDAVNDTLRQQLEAIEKIRTLNCKGIGTTNFMLTTLWLYNTDPDLKKLQADMTAGGTKEAIGAFGNVKAMAAGLGLVPREVILRERIRTLTEMVNAPAAKAVTLDSINTMKTGPDPSSKERTIDAFLSAYYTLGPHVFPGADVVMDELLPGGDSKANLLKLDDLKAKFTVWYTDLSNIGGATGCGPKIDATAVTADSQRDCDATLCPITTFGAVPVGIKKDPTMLTYYAVRLKARAKLLFSPFGDLTLKAYAAAQPFGSRLGPLAIADSDFLANAQPVTPPGPGAAYEPNIPNLPIRKGDTSAKGAGWWSPAVLNAYYNAFGPPSGGTGTWKNQPIGLNEMFRAYQVAMVPTEWEIGKYNIPSDETPDGFQKFFDSKETFAFWAPIVPPADIGRLKDRLKDAMDQLMDSTNPSGNAADAVNGNKLKDDVRKSLEEYVNSLGSGKGEFGESVNIARIANPFRHVHAPDTGKPISVPGVTVGNPNDFKTSWNAVNDGKFRPMGRIGYSIKFVSFSSLREAKMPPTSGQSWTNEMQLDAEGEVDVPKLRH